MSEYNNFFNQLLQTSVDWLGSIAYLLIILIIGLIIAGVVKNIIKTIFAKIGADRVLTYEPIKSFIANAKIKVSVPQILGEIGYWSIVLVTLSAVAEAANIAILSSLVRSIIEYLPNVIVAAIMLLVVLIASNLVANLVATVARGSGFSKYADILSKVVRVSILVFGIIITIEQLQVDISIITDNLTVIIMGISFGISLAAGLAFGLGGQEKAKMYLNKWL